jgi:hypothetical protein
VTTCQRLLSDSRAYNTNWIMIYTTHGQTQRCIDTGTRSLLNLGIVCDGSKQLVLADSSAGQIVGLTGETDEEKLIHFRGNRMRAPHYVCFSPDRTTMVITDGGNHTVQIYEKHHDR